MPKLAIISDIHANLPALEAVILELNKHNPDYWICLGDIVGYGPNPKECIGIIMEMGMKCVLGNHDAVLTGMLDFNHFRGPNKRLMQLTKNMLTEKEIGWLKTIPLVISNPEHDWFAAHSDPVTPEEWIYVESAFKARQLLTQIEEKYCFIGHTHRPALVSDKIGLNQFKKDHKYLINPGSVGQSRDEDRRASCAFLDTDNAEYKNIRVPYNEEMVFYELNSLGFTEREASKLLRMN